MMKNCWKIASAALLMISLDTAGTVEAMGAGPAPDPKPELREEIPSRETDRSHARLVRYTWNPTDHALPPRETWPTDAPAFLRDRLWYPNPFSSPVPWVIVTSPCDLGIAVLELDGRSIDSYEFEAVDTGCYGFTPSRPYAPTRPCILRLFHAGEPVNDIRMRSDFGIPD